MYGKSRVNSTGLVPVNERSDIRNIITQASTTGRKTFRHLVPANGCIDITRLLAAFFGLPTFKESLGNFEVLVAFRLAPLFLHVPFVLRAGLLLDRFEVLMIGLGQLLLSICIKLLGPCPDFLDLILQLLDLKLLGLLNQRIRLGLELTYTLTRAGIRFRSAMSARIICTRPKSVFGPMV